MPDFFKKHYINDILFYEPKIFNEKVALSCRLFPFTKQKLQLLAVMDIIVGEEEIKKRLKKYAAIVSGAERAEQNLEVLKSLTKKENITPETLKNYSGWGGLKDAISNPDIYKELKSQLSDDEIDSIKRTLSSAYYTPELLVKFMWTALLRMGFRYGNILEPAVGTGIFFDHMPPIIRQWSDLDAVEIDRITCNILVNKHPDVHLTCSGFEKVHYGKKRYDLIISNPPYGKEVINDMFNPDLSHLIIHHWFVAKCARILKEKGIIAMVLPQFFLDNVKDHARDIINDAGVGMIAAYRLPDNLFSNAKVTVDIVFLQKAETNIKWLNTGKITIGNDTKPLNEYFINNPEHILGELQVVPMYNRTGITCKEKGNLRDHLYDACLKITRLT